MAKKITFPERVKIFGLLNRNYSVSLIAQTLNRHISSIYREINRVSGLYCLFIAQNDSILKCKNSKRKKIFQNKELKSYVLEKIQLYWSPEQIKDILKIKFPSDKKMRVSTETIYKFIYDTKDLQEKKRLIRFLRRRKKYRKSRKRKTAKRGTIPNMRSIHERPVEVENRKIIGHWEGDLIIGKDHKTAIGTLVERSSRFTIIVPLIKNKDSCSTIKAFINTFKPLPKRLKKTLTYDRGKEMTNHEFFTKETNIPVYFADPHSPWQRGTNENTNGLIRTFFPKGTDFATIKLKDFSKVQELLNNRPRKSLGFLTPKEFLQRKSINLR